MDKILYLFYFLPNNDFAVWHYETAKFGNTRKAFVLCNSHRHNSLAQKIFQIYVIFCCTYLPESYWRNNSPFCCVFNSCVNWNSAQDGGFLNLGSIFSFALALSAVLFWDRALGIWETIGLSKVALQSSTTVLIFVLGFSMAAILTAALAWKFNYWIFIEHK